MQVSINNSYVSNLKKYIYLFFVTSITWIKMDANGQETIKEEHTEYLTVTDLFKHGSKVLNSSIILKIN